MELVFSLRVLQNVIDMKESVVNKVRMFPSKNILKNCDWQSQLDTCNSWKGQFESTDRSWKVFNTVLSNQEFFNFGSNFRTPFFPISYC